MAKYGPKPIPAADRFFSKVEKTVGCWLWTANKNNKGYGMFQMKSPEPKMLAHRASWLLAGRELPPKGRNLLHRCDTPACVHPDHLFIGTQGDNMMDMAEKGRSGNDNRAATSKEVELMHRLYADGYSQQAIANLMKFHQTYISRVLRGDIIKLR